MSIKNIEKQHNVKILFAVRAGSHGYGFAKPDSDTDIRFVYLTSSDQRISLFNLDDTITHVVSDKEEWHGWELKKFCTLAIRGNIEPQEWVQLNYIYCYKSFLPIIEQVRDSFNPKAALFTYSGHYKSYLDKNGDKYLLHRNRLAHYIQWIWVNGSMPKVDLNQHNT